LSLTYLQFCFGFSGNVVSKYYFDPSVHATVHLCSQGDPGVNFTNVLRAAFTREDPKSAKKLLNLIVFLALLGSVPVKAAHRMLVKLNPGFFFFSKSETNDGKRSEEDPVAT
jgi:hypothetical protein